MIKEYFGANSSAGSWASFDYCFNYFQTAKAAGRIGQIASPGKLMGSCSHLWNFMGSWGMLARGTPLSQTNLSVLRPVVELLANERYRPVWSLDVESDVATATAGYFALDGAGNLQLTPEAKLMLDLERKMVTALKAEFAKIKLVATPTVTVTTKLLHASTGCVPALDSVVMANTNCRKLNEQTLRKIYDYHAKVASTVANARRKTTVLWAGQTQTGSFLYTQAKVLDEIFTEA